MLHIQKEAALRPLLACGAYENKFPETIGIKIAIKTLIHQLLAKNRFQPIPTVCEIFSKDSVRISNTFCIFVPGTNILKLWLYHSF